MRSEAKINRDIKEANINMVQHIVGQGNNSTPYWDEYAQGIIDALNLQQLARGEWHGACPNCGGKDRFWISQYQGEVRVQCRQCDDFSAITKELRARKLLPEFTPEKKATVMGDVTPFPEIDTDNEYLKRKRIQQHGAKLDGPDLMIPIVNKAGKRVGTQIIEPDGKKKFNQGLQPNGCFHVVGGPITDFAYLCEGFATAAAVHESTGRPAIHCLNANNITNVIEVMREVKPNAELIIAGDNDAAGRKACEKAFEMFGVTHVIPNNEGFDWNDVFVARGPEYTKTQLEPKSALDDVFFPDDVQISTSANYIIKGWLSDDSMSIVYGPSNVGKTFFCQDMAWHVAANEPWQGNKVRGGPVLYLQTEGGLSWQARIAALRQKYPDHKNVRLAIRAAPINLFNSEEDINRVKAILDEMAKKYGPVRMIVVDTISRATQGQLNENDNSEMAQFVANLDALRAETGIHVQMVAHSGKDISKGVRGASSLKAAADTEIELTLDEEMSVRTAVATKQRDMEVGKSFNFILETQKMGDDDDGDPITTCTIREATGEEMEQTRKPKISGKNQLLFKKVFYQLRGERIGGPNPSGAGWPDGGKFWCIDEETIKDHFKGKLVGAANPSQSYIQAFRSLEGGGHIAINEGKIWFTDKDGRSNDPFD